MTLSFAVGPNFLSLDKLSIILWKSLKLCCNAQLIEFLKLIFRKMQSADITFWREIEQLTSSIPETLVSDCFAFVFCFIFKYPFMRLMKTFLLFK